MMQRSLFVVVYAACSIVGTLTDSELDFQAKSIVDKLTVNQLLGQMNQIDINSFKTTDSNGNIIANLTIVAEYAKEYVGSYLNHPFGSPWGVKYNLNATEFRNQLVKIQELHMATSGIPILHGIDSVHGANYIYNATLLPQHINTGATFNRNLAKLAGHYTGRDTKAAGIPWVFGPMLEPVRHKHWSRVYESLNEDPVAVSQLATAYIEGMQSQNVAACVKHLIAYSDPIDGNDRSNVNASSYELMNYFVPPFKAAIDGGALSAMGSYIALNGVPVAANDITSKNLLRKDLKFNGTLVTDYGEVYLLRRDHKVVATDLDAVELWLNKTSYDMSMVPWDTSYITYGKELFDASRIKIDRLKESVTRIIKLKLQLDLFKTPVPGAELVSQVGDAGSEDAALNIARESMVLLKNKENILPLSSTSPVLLTGPSMDNIGYLCGGWTLYWQGVSGNHVFPHGKSIRRAASEISSQVQYIQGMDIDGKFTTSLEETKAAAKNASIVVIALGEYPYAEDKGNAIPQSLPDEYLNYVQEIASTGAKIVLVLVEGRPRTLNGLAELADAVIWAGLPCELGGQAIAEVLFGKVNPSGKLPYTYPKTDAFINLATPYYQRNGSHCLKTDVVQCTTEWAFGEGLSYTTFEYTNAKLSSSALTFQTSIRSTLNITVTVKNTGTTAGQETVMLFVTPPSSRPNAETKLLKRFTKIALASGESKLITFQMSADDWGYYSGQLGEGLTKSAPSGSYIFAFKAGTDCVNDPKNPMCMSLEWTNPSNAPIPANEGSGDGNRGTGSKSLSGCHVTIAFTALVSIGIHLLNI